MRSPADGTVIVRDAWGPGVAWTLEALTALLGADDDPAAFVPRHRTVARAHHKHAGLRLPRTGLVMDSLVPTVLEQRITTGSARYAWRRLLARYGEQPPGPAPHGMRVMPSPQMWRMILSWDWHRAGVDRSRATAILRACHRAPRLEEAATVTLPDAMARLQLIPGIGPWTAAESLQRTSAHQTPSPLATSTYPSRSATPSPAAATAPTGPLFTALAPGVEGFAVVGKTGPARALQDRAAAEDQRPATAVPRFRAS